jgi:hypothetical protein
MTDELADRRAAVLARLRAAELARTIAELEQAVDHRGEQIEASKRKHPSNGRVYDQEVET